MTAALESPASTVDKRRASLSASRRTLLLGALGLLVLLSAVRALSGADDLTSSGTSGAALRLAVPIGLAGLGGLWAERAGIVNIGLEGMLILGTWFGAYVGYFHGPWWGVLAGVAAGAVGGLLHAVATVSFGVDHVVSGVAINLLGSGVARYLSSLAYGDGQVPGAGETQSPTTRGLPTVSLPVLSGGPDLLGDLERQDLFLLSDAAGLLRGLTADVSLLTLLAVVLVPVSFFVLWRTAFGLRLRSVGENPVAADSLGVPVYRMKYAAVVVSGALAGLGGASLVLGSIYREGQTAGRGFIGLAAVIFGNWRPGGLAAGAALFGYADAVQLRAGSAVRALLLLVALLLVVVAVRQALRRRIPLAVAAVLLAVAFGLWYATVETVPSQLVGFTPHLVTLLVLAVASQRLRPPAADGQPYRRGQQT
ncbi:MAG: Nucleoside transporter rane protein [Frankiales bacterium]|nr:Nucleoside transporter rane protein [Frankiales bacterium]